MASFKQLLRGTVMALALSTLCVVGASAANVGVGTVTADALRMRSEASTDASILATAPKGENVVVLEAVEDGWYKVDYEAVEGYMSGEFLEIREKADVELGYGKVNTDGSPLNVRSAPDAESDRLTTLSDNKVVNIVGVDSGWFKIEVGNIMGYVLSDYMLPCRDEYGNRGDNGSGSIGEQIVAFAKTFLGTPYVYGGNGPSCFDCSGFTKYVYAHFGYNINRGATQQLSNGTAISRSQLQPGDLVFFRHNTSKPVSHVGIYIGNNQFIHASTNAYKVQINDLSGHYANTYVYARHIY